MVCHDATAMTREGTCLHHASTETPSPSMALVLRSRIRLDAEVLLALA